MTLPNLPNFNFIQLACKGYGNIELRTTLFDSAKVLRRLIKDAERIVRTSIEYKRWVGFVRGVLGTNFVCYYSGLAPTECNIEIHHHPYTLYNIVEVVVNNLLNFGQPINTFMVSEYVMALHFMNAIGFVPLAKTYHEKYHKKALQIPASIVEGNWKLFESLFEIPDENKNRAELLMQYDNVDGWYIQEATFNNTVQPIVSGGVKNV